MKLSVQYQIDWNIKVLAIIESDIKMIKHFSAKFYILVFASLKIPLASIVFMQIEVICKILAPSDVLGSWKFHRKHCFYIKEACIQNCSSIGLDRFLKVQPFRSIKDSQLVLL